MAARIARPQAALAHPVLRGTCASLRNGPSTWMCESNPAPATKFSKKDLDGSYKV